MPLFQGNLPNRHFPLFYALDNAGFEAYYVGGCTRDMLMNREPADFDIATNALPSQVTCLFEEMGLKVAQSGERFGGVAVYLDGEKVDVTTYRSDGKGRKPAVKFAKTLEEDAMRRDFTIGSIYVNPLTMEIRDPNGGVADINRRLIRAVGNPNDRFVEDGLRPIRAARFAATLGFYIADSTFDAMSGEVARREVGKLAKDRLRDELLKAHSVPNVEPFWSALYGSRLLDFILPEMAPCVGLQQPFEYHAWDVYTHQMKTAEAIKTSSPFLRFIAAIHDIGKPDTVSVKENEETQFLEHEHVGSEIVERRFKALRFVSGDVEMAATLIRLHLVPYDGKWSNGTIRRWVEKAGGHWDDLLSLREADLRAHGRPVEGKLALLDEFRERVAKMQAVGEVKPLKLALDGNALTLLTGLSGPSLGKLIVKLKESVTDDPTLNTPEALGTLAKEYKP